MSNFKPKKRRESKRSLRELAEIIRDAEEAKPERKHVYTPPEVRKHRV